MTEFPVVVVNPMKSRRPTGIGIAADAVAGLLPENWARTSPILDRLFALVNDSRLPSSLKALFRITVSQYAALKYRKHRLIFATHHGPLWRTRRHAVIVYDTIPLQFPAQARAQTTYYRTVLPKVLRCAERVVTISEAVRAELRLEYPRITNVTVIPAWSPFVIESSTAKSQRVNSGTLLVVGARYPHKDLDTVLAALEKSNNSRSTPIKLVVAGCRREIWAHAWGGLDWFERKGWVQAIERVSPEELAVLYSEAHALVYPSLAEGQGLPPLEAMSRGTAVICSDLPVMRETCGDGAWYFTPGDPQGLQRVIEHLCSETGQVEQLRKQAIYPERLQLFGQASLAERWRKFIRSW